MDIFIKDQPFVFGQATYLNGGSYGPVTQEHIDLSYIEEGEVLYYADGKFERFDKGVAIFIYNMDRFEVTFPENKTTIATWCHSGVLSIQPKIQQQLKNLPKSLTPSRLLISLLKYGCELGSGQNTDLLRVRNSLGAALFNEYFRLAHLEGEESELPKSVLKVKNHIIHHYQRKCSLGDLAQVANITPNHLLVVFKKHIGITPTQFLWNVRSEKGLHLLKNTGLSVGEIAYSCGFQSPHHFSRVIKERYQCTPTELRANKWMSDPGIVNEGVYDSRFATKNGKKVIDPER